MNNQLSAGALIIGFGLVTANGISTKQFQNIGTLAVKGDTTLVPQVRKDLVYLGGEVLFVLILAFIANTGPAAHSLIIALLVALWLVWSVNSGAQIGSWSTILTKAPGSKA